MQEHGTVAGLVERVADMAERLARWVGIALFTAMLVLMALEVVARYVFNAPTFWTEVIARYAMVWMVLLGMALGIRHREHIRVDGLVLVSPRVVQIVLAGVRLLCSLGFALILVAFGYQLSVMNLTQTAGVVAIPVFYLYLAVPITGLLMLVFLGEIIARRDIRPF